MSIDSIKFGLGSIKPMPKTLEPDKAPVKAEGAKTSFSDMFKQAVSDVNDLQGQANKQIEGLLLHKPGVTTHDAMIALEKADVAFQLMNNVRSKIIRAYEEVMRTQV